MRWVRLAVGALAVSGAIWLTIDGTASSAEEATPPPDGAELFETSCSSCHGADGSGTAEGPSIVDEGRAAADFVLRTGRMPPGDIGIEAIRRPVQFDDAEIAAMVDFVGSLGDGPDVPIVDTSTADVTAGGVLFRENCAACHQAAGAGGALTKGRFAPSLLDATPTQIGEAVIVGPGAMPVFSTFTDEQINDVAAYVVALQENGDHGGASLGRVGPVAEGLLAWIGVGLLVGATIIIGTRRLA